MGRGVHLLELVSTTDRGSEVNSSVGLDNLDPEYSQYGSTTGTRGRHVVRSGSRAGD